MSTIRKSWLQLFLETYQIPIIRTWLGLVEKEAPQLKEIMAELADHLYAMLLNPEVPVEQDPRCEAIYNIFHKSGVLQMPLDSLPDMFHLLRLSIMQFQTSYIYRQHIPPEETTPAVFSLHQRIHAIQKALLEKQRSESVGQLHLDRLSLLGKMAASMAHELRNPLFAIEGMLRLIESELSHEERSKVKRYLDVVQQEFSGLYGQITGFLSFSRNQQMEEMFVNCRLSELVAAVLELIRPRLNNEGVEVELDLQLDPSLTIQKIALQQVLFNLLNNSLDALAYGPYPKLIQLHSHEDEDSYYVDITDYGEGIPEHLKDSIFTPFVTSKSKGTGLGLSICKQIMEKNGGEISFTSQKGMTVFTLRFFKEGSALLADQTMAQAVSRPSQGEVEGSGG
ncbi:sensor histidine kinase [Brevibacillus marinus]|uniref:sensor histidine kinase n=1 Tax=Brevibacillus marinus TaxID=2496837 RepID=UPI0013E0A455|nr:HAMP domain-containing sensor histidine kinase [Brevibacillus marinus]